jgi:hypothetical protein
MRKCIILINILFISLPAALLSQWGSDIRLTYDLGYSITHSRTAVAVEEDTIHVSWRDDRDGNKEIYYKRSTDSGESWGSDTRLTNDSDNSEYPSIGVSGCDVHIAWYDDRDGNNEIYYKRSTDNGTSWGSDTRLTNNSSTSYRPSIAISGSYVHIAWYDMRNGNNEVYYKRSTDNGGSWGSDTRLTNNSTSSLYPCVAASGNNVHIVWYDNPHGNYEIYYKRSTDNGGSWGSDIRLTNNSASSFYPCVWASGNNVHVVWYDMRDGNYEIYYKRSTNNGGSWGSDTRLTNNSALSYRPSVTALGNDVHVVWRDMRDGNAEIYHKVSTDNGGSWGSDTRLTNDSGTSMYPTIALSDNYAHVVWTDDRDGNNEIYYKRNPEITGIETPSFFATSEFSSIKLQWRLEIEHQLMQYLIHKKSVGEGEDYSEIARIPACGSSPSPQTYFFRDRGVKSGVRYFYKLGVVAIDGNTTWYGPISATVIAEKPFLKVSPNPFSTATTISLRGVSDYRSIGVSEIQIFDISGREVKSLSIPNSRFPILNYVWDGRDDYGRRASPGIYFIRLRSGDYTVSKKVLLMR